MPVGSVASRSPYCSSTSVLAMADGGEKDVSSSKKLNVKAAAFVPKFGAQLASDVVGGVASKVTFETCTIGVV